MSDNAAVPTLFIVDDGDTRLKYQPPGAWDKSGCSYDSQILSGTSTAGSSVSFSFNGTLIAVYGILGKQQGSAEFTLDDEDSVHVSFPPQDSPVEQPFYWSDVLPLKEHTLNLTATKNGSYFCLSKMQYTGYAISTSSSASAIRTNVGTQASFYAAGSTSLPSTTSAVARSEQGVLNTGAIAGITFGCTMAATIVILTILYACGWKFCLKRDRRPSPERQMKIDLDAVDPPEAPLPYRGMDLLQKFLSQNGVRRYNNPQTSSSGPTSQGASSTMFTSVIIMTPPTSNASSGDRPARQTARRP
ncbi:hypothetical protein WOLCODRAFT_165928 [Wolfiporia cocos MD-104 SS10]|uniref:Uncharacterized protein n=1 Tax=Wolfiporia cocos (strain MD-104) TaxID=742152 RepID=A0A2H3J8A5_WOLCO|nr:hypothetical protein WOLCODRAFT_165928 [Wolfiporia cocos MD-104 SS10]